MFCLTNKIRCLISAFIAVILVLAFLVGRTFVVNRDAANEKFDAFLDSATFTHLTISTADGVILYDNAGFAEDSLTRMATFHLIGDKNDGIVNSMIATKRSATVVKDDHQYFQQQNVELTIDASLQINAYTTLKNQPYSESGCIIVLDYKTGEVKAMTSIPSLDVMNTDYIPDGTYLNKALYSYVPGSVFKAVSVATVLELHPEAKNFTYNCNAQNSYVSCSYAHGTVSLAQALEKSCNCAVSQLVSTYITSEELTDFIEMVGLTSKEQLSDMLCNQKGNLNAEADLKWTANGQGETLLTPISIARYYGLLANDGVCVDPHILADTETKKEHLVSVETSRFITSSLEDVIGDRLSCNAFGKTGTAQLSDTQSHSWFVCSLTDEQAPTYTVLCFLEQGGTSLNAKEVILDFINDCIL